MKPSNYKRFFGLLKAYNVPNEERDAIIAGVTGGKKTSLRDLTLREYGEVCKVLEAHFGNIGELRAERSRVLKLMQQMGVNTSSWDRVNALTTDKRIAGKRFAKLSTDELKELYRKLKGIQRKGGFNAPAQSEDRGAEVIVTYNIEALPKN